MRYIILAILNLPVVLLAAVNILTQYKMKRISVVRFRNQVILWASILVVLVGSFPLYNYVSGRYIFDSSELSLFDIVQTTALIALFYVTNHQRQNIERTNAMTRDLHREISIILADQKQPKK